MMNVHLFHTASRTPAGDALEEFMLLGGRYSNFTKETFFIRCASGSNYDADVARLQAWAGQEGTAGRVFVPSLTPCLPTPQVEKYVALYQGGQISFPFHFANPAWQDAMERGFDRIVDLFQQASGRYEPSIMRNFSVKILCWIDTYFPKLFVETWKMNRFPKFSCGGRLKVTEYLFLYLLFLLGCDVLYISPTGEAAVESPELLALSTPVKSLGVPAPKPVPGEKTVSPARPASPVRSAPAAGPVISADRLRRPERHLTADGTAAPASAARTVSSLRPAPAAGTVQPSAPPARSSALQPPAVGARRALEFEELARRAASVVMLQVFDESGQCFKSGSGVIISSKGYVLTNFHVVSGGRRFGILLENETDIFYTDELIKYHPEYDLAILRMQQHRAPIPVYRGDRALARGQKVVAIGSPLGLFNSVSDGIISGFRDLEKVSMIQFTAPVSHGSSGGALLDMYGDLIGLITGGYNDGQNLNLAVGCQTILQFAGGLI